MTVAEELSEAKWQIKLLKNRMEALENALVGAERCLVELFKSRDRAGLSSHALTYIQEGLSNREEVLCHSQIHRDAH